MIKLSLIFVLFFTVASLADGDFAKHDAEMYQLLGKINTNETAVKNLIKEKNETTDVEKSKEILVDIKKNLNDRKENIRKYNKVYNHVLYEHPGKMNYPGENEEKKKGEHEKPKEQSSNGKEDVVRYKRYDERSIQEFEDETNKLLSDTYQNVKKKYNSK